MKALEQLLKRCYFKKEDVILLVEGPNLKSDSAKQTYDYLQNRLTQDSVTLLLLGDCSFNACVIDKPYLEGLSFDQRIILSSHRLFQMFLLDASSLIAPHPSLSMLGLGKYSSYIMRNKDYNFPFGSQSSFKDLYDFNAIVLYLGEPQFTFEARYAYANHESAVIFKNNAYHKDSIISYLDVETNDKLLHEEIFNSSLLLSEDHGEETFYATRYKDMIDYLNDIFDKDF